MYSSTLFLPTSIQQKCSFAELKKPQIPHYAVIRFPRTSFLYKTIEINTSLHTYSRNSRADEFFSCPARILAQLVSYFYIGDFMRSKKFDTKVHMCYTDNGKSFKELLSEGIKLANLENIKMQIFTSNATSEKECAKDE